MVAFLNYQLIKSLSLNMIIGHIKPEEMRLMPRAKEGLFLLFMQKNNQKSKNFNLLIFRQIWHFSELLNFYRIDVINNTDEILSRADNNGEILSAKKIRIKNIMKVKV